MRVLPTSIHGIIDYLWGAALIAAPFLLGWSGATLWLALVFGVGAILYSLLTDYEMGLIRLIPVPVHLFLDGAAGLVLAVLPWLAGLSGRGGTLLSLFGVFAVAASLVTKSSPASGPAR